MESTTLERERAASRLAAWLGVVFALVFPTIVTWAYFFRAADAGQGIQQAVMATLKVLQFAFPVVWVMFVLRERIEWRRPIRAGRRDGAAVRPRGGRRRLAVFRYVLASSPLFVAATEQIRAKVAGFGLDSVAEIRGSRRVLFARPFALGGILLAVVRVRTTAATRARSGRRSSSRRSASWPTTSWCSRCISAGGPGRRSCSRPSVAVGGAFWAWLYDRSGSLVGPWLSHLVIDAGIFFIGFQLVRGSLG